VDQKQRGQTGLIVEAAIREALTTTMTASVGLRMTTWKPSTYFAIYITKIWYLLRLFSILDLRL